jgi:hypothetical protein
LGEPWANGRAGHSYASPRPPTDSVRAPALLW